MNFLDFPLELAQAVLEEAVWCRGLKRGLRLRLVNKMFADEVRRAVFASGLLDDHLENAGYAPVALRSEYLEFQARQRNAAQRNPRIGIIRKATDYLAIEESQGASTDIHHCRVLSTLCAQAARHGSQFSAEVPIAERKVSNYLANDLLVAAVCTNQISVVRRLLGQTCSPLECSEVFGLPHVVAARQGHTEILNVLLSRPQTSTASKYIALNHAAAAGQVETVKAILEASWAPWRRPAETIFEHGTDRSLFTPSIEIFESIMAVRKPARLKRYFPTYILRILLDECAIRGWTDMTRYLLGLRTPPGVQLWSRHNCKCLKYACRGGFVDIARLLLDHGCPTDGALAAAAAHGHTVIVQLLLDYGVETKLALAGAARGGHLQAVRILLDSGADVNEGFPAPIVHAVELEHIPIFELLIERGADLTSAGVREEARRKAKAAGLESMVERLAKHGVE